MHVGHDFCLNYMTIRKYETRSFYNSEALPYLYSGTYSERYPRGARGGKHLGPKGDGVQGKGCPLLLGRKIFDFLTSLDAFSGPFLAIL